jgi:hypothetical protein
MTVSDMRIVSSSETRLNAWNNRIRLCIDGLFAPGSEIALYEGYDSVSAYSSDKARNIFPFKAFPHTVLCIALRLIVLTSLAKSFPYATPWSPPAGTTDMTARCGKIVLRHSVILFFLIVSFVTPEHDDRPASKASFAAFL